MPGKSTLKTIGLAGVKKRLRGTPGPKGVKVGILGGEASDVLMAAIANEFGTEDIPERSYIRATMREHHEKYKSALQKGIQKVASGAMSMEQMLGLIGIEVVKDVQMTMRHLKEPANAPSTIKAKGSANPLIDTGRLLNSIHFEVVDVKEKDRKK